jgi:hypothetical protein
MRSRKYSNWTTEDDAILRKMTGEKKSALLIAAKLRRSLTSVRRRGTEIGAAVVSMRETKMRAREAAKPTAETRGEDHGQP